MASDHAHGSCWCARDTATDSGAAASQAAADGLRARRSTGRGYRTASDNCCMPVGDDTLAYRRRLPHLSKAEKTYFVTFCTHKRFILPERVRDAVLKSCTHDHPNRCWLHCAVVMPDHVHLLITPHERTIAADRRLDQSASAYRVNRLTGRSGSLWQQESFDRIMRRGEDIQKKAEYICQNPVRAGLVSSWNEYPWIWRAHVERRPLRPPTG